MALDPHPDREPGMDARVYCKDGCHEYVRTADEGGGWFLLGGHSFPLSWPELAQAEPEGTVVLP